MSDKFFVARLKDGSVVVCVDRGADTSYAALGSGGENRCISRHQIASRRSLSALIDRLPFPDDCGDE